MLRERFVLVLGEPGSGKSSVVNLVVHRAIEKGWTPTVSILKGFDGDIAKTFDPPVDDSSAIAGDRLYVLDGLDEVPEEQLVNVVRSIETLLRADPRNRILLTSRQAFYAMRADLFRGREPVSYHLLDLTSDDVDTLIQRAGIDRVAFLKAAELGRVDSELRNPFVLSSLIQLFKDTGRLTSSRSGAVKHVVYQLLSERPTGTERHQVRALRMLAVAMEVAARNQLTQAQAAKTLVTAMKIDDEQAARLLEELTLSILVRTNDGYAFQMASHGEYLAAEDLSDRLDVTRFLPLMRLQGSQVLSDSWQNTASYLAELHRGFRSWLVKNRPEWAIAASPSCFSDIEKAKVVAAVTGELVAKHLLLGSHPTISAGRLALFVGDLSRAKLHEQLRGGHPVGSANALLLLGASKDPSVAEHAMALALDETQDVHLRRSGLSALEFVGRSEMVPALLQIADWSNDLAAARLDAASSLAEPGQFQMLLEALSKTETMISGAHQRFSEFESDDAVRAMLGAVESIAPERLTFRMSGYLEPIWKLMIRRWNPEWSARVAKLVLGRGHEYEYDSAMEELIKLLASASAVGSQVGTAIVENLRAEPRPVQNFNHHALRLIGEADAKRALETDDKEVLRNIRAFGSMPARVFLHNQDPVKYIPSPREAQWQKDDEKRKEFLARQQETALDESVEPRERLNALWRIHDTKNWPFMTAERTTPLAVMVEKELYALDLRNSIEWLDENQCRRPQSLSFFLEILEHYGMRLVDDQVLALAIMASQQHEVGKYFDRLGFSATAVDALERLLGDVSVADGAKESLLRFIASKQLATASLADAVEQLATITASDRLKSAAVSALIRMAETVPVLKRLRTHVSANDVERIDLALIEKADRATTERRLTELLDHPAKLEEGEAEHPWDNKLGWLGNITEPHYWEKLKRIRRQALRDARGRVSSTLSQVMVGIDPMRAAAVLEEQLADTPSDWQPFVRSRAVQIRHEGTIREAQNTPFDKILARLRRATTMRLFKIACEGPRDIPAFEALASKLPGDVGEDIQVQSVGGWANVLAPEWNPSVLTTGSHDQMVILDGDRARDFAHPAKPLRPDVRRVLEKFKNAGVDCVVLERYALENYFSEGAYMSVIGAHVVRYCPLDPDRSIEAQIPDYRKEMNGALGAATSLADLEGTDLCAALSEIADRAGI